MFFNGKGKVRDMKAFIISDNLDSLLGMQIAGIQGTIANNREETLKVLRSIKKDKSIGLIIVTEKIGNLISDEAKKMKQTKGMPLIVEIPDRNGSIRPENYIANSVKEAIGVKI